jgi:hypothetical protein
MLQAARQSVAATLKPGDRLILSEPVVSRTRGTLTELVVLRITAPEVANRKGVIPANKDGDGMVDYMTYPGCCWAMPWRELEERIDSGEFRLERAIEVCQ